MIYTTSSSIQSERLIRHCSCMCRQDMFQNFARIWHRKAKINPLNHKPFLRKKSPVHRTKNKPAFGHTVTDPRFFDTDSPYLRAIVTYSHPWLCLGLPSAMMLECSVVPRAHCYLLLWQMQLTQLETYTDHNYVLISVCWLTWDPCKN